MQNDTFNVAFPIDMIKQEERIVTGIATADNIDKSGDIIEFDATLTAFKAWRGNIREMHAPVAVGKAVDYEPINLDFEGSDHKAMQLSAYISKGAQSTWEKILDGTLSAFSVGGRILERVRDEELTKELGRPITRIKKYELGEVSIVDNPANPAAVVELIKSDGDGTLYYALENDQNDIESNEDLLKNENYDNLQNVIDESVDTNVLESNFSVEEKVSLLRRFVNWLVDDKDDDLTFASDNFEELDKDDSSEDSEGDMIDMDIETIKEALAAVVDEKLSVMREEITTYIDEKHEEIAKNVIVEEVEEVTVEEATAEESTEIEDAVVAFRQELDEALSTIEEQKTALSEASAKIEDLESSGAMKKSVESDDELEEEEVVIEKSEETFWTNAYLPRELIKSLGYDS